MHDLRLTLGIVGLAAACGPVAPQQTTSDSDSTSADDNTGDSTDGGPGTDTDPTGEPPEPTSTTTSPPACVDASDCFDVYCGYCDAGVCKEGFGCCGVAGARPDAQRWRCGPYYECYGDSDCPDGELCEFGECVPLPIPDVLPPCPALDMLLGQWQLGATPGAFVLADLDADGDLDLAAAEPGVAQIEVALNDGAGGFTLAGAFGVGAPTVGLAMIATKLDDIDPEDLDLDLAVARSDAAGGLILAFGQDAVFTPKPVVPTSPSPGALLSAGFVDSDFLTDLITIGPTGVHTHLGIDPGEEILALADPLALGANLVDFDDKTGLIGVIAGTTTVGIWTSVGDGHFTPAFLMDVQAEVSAVMLEDINQVPGADLPALIVTRTVDDLGEVEVRAEIDAPEKFAAPVFVRTSVPIVDAVAFDVDAPQGADILATTGQASVLMVLGDAEGGFACERIVAIPAPTTQALLVAGDLNDDTHVDLVVGDPNSATVTVLLAP